ncbi:MAG: accessory gene regulator B family protein [Lachnospiraceae bacterium]|nr:accessory gene regulator B family protein [Lachnospiraceae bacterium]
MIEKLADKMIEFQVSKGTIHSEDANIYRYGYILLFEIIINIFISFLMGILLGKIQEVIFFLLLFITLRSFCGGYHAKRIWECIVLSNAVMACAIVINIYFGKYVLPVLLYVTIVIVLSVIICSMAPVDNKNKRLNEKERIFYKKCSIITAIIENGIGITMILLGQYSFAYIVIYVYIIQLISIIIGKRCKG